MELIHHICANATFSRTNSIKLNKHVRFENSASSTKTSGFLKSKRRRGGDALSGDVSRCEASRERARYVLSAGSGERGLVEPTGIEPVTFWLQTRRSPS